MFHGYARLAFVVADGTEEGHRYNPGDIVELPTDTPAQEAEVKKLMGMGVIQRTDPAGNVGKDGEPEQLDDVAPPAGAATLRARQPSGRAAQKLAEKEQRGARD